MLSWPCLPGSPLIASLAEPDPPTRLGKYLLVRKLAHGGMGDVHLAKLSGELGFEKLLVVKTIRAELAADPRFVELFASEAKTAVGLSHPNITPIYELGRAEDGSLYTAMGWVDGPSLARWIERVRHEHRRFELGAVLLILRELLDGLAHAHSHDHGRLPVVHRDITPRNVLVDRSGRVQIVDFGIAKPVDAAEVRGVMGSIGYMAPEQARGEPVDPRADVFSVGCVFYELLTLEQAFPREGVWMAPDLALVPVELRGLLERALALDPAARFADAREFLRQLAPLQAELAPSFATPDLAAALRQQFASGDWTGADPRERAGATPSTHVTPVHQTVAFATRITAVDHELDIDPDSSEGDEATDSDVSGRAIAIEAAPAHEAAPAREARRLHPLIWVGLGAAAALFVALLGLPLLDRDRPLPQPSVANPPTPAEPTPAPMPSQSAEPTPSSSGDATQTLEITLAPEHAELWLDGVRLEGPAFELALARPRTAELRAAGHRTRSVELDPRGSKQLHFDLDPLGEGQLTVLAPNVAWAEVWLDGEKLGSTPLTEQSVVEGRHKLEVRCTAEVCEAERVLTRKSIQIRAGRSTKITAADPDE